VIDVPKPAQDRCDISNDLDVIAVHDSQSDRHGDHLNLEAGQRSFVEGRSERKYPRIHVILHTWQDFPACSLTYCECGVQDDILIGRIDRTPMVVRRVASP